MPQIEISDADDRKLRQAAPSYLQGDRTLAKRVAWVIDEYCREQDEKRERAVRNGREQAVS